MRKITENKNFYLYAQYIKTRYRNICPYGKKYLEELTGQMLRRVFTAALITSILIVIWNLLFVPKITCYMMGSIVLGIYLVCMELPNREVQDKETKLYQELLLYLSRVKHKYIMSHHIPNAVYDASEGLSYEIEQHAKQLYYLLMDAGRKEKVKEYVTDRRENNYLKLFLVQAYEASEKGDIWVEKSKSLFLENVEHLRLEIMEELFRRKKRMHEFSGYIFVSVTPVFMMPVLKQWGMEFAAELSMFYEGMGKILEIVALCGTAAIYCLVNRAKDIVLYAGGGKRAEWLSILWDTRLCQKTAAYFERADGKYSRKMRELLLQSGEVCSMGRFCTKMAVIAVGSTVVLLFAVVGIHRNERRAILETVSAIDSIAPLASAEKKEIIEDHILHIVSEYKESEAFDVIEMEQAVKERLPMGNQTTQTAVMEEIISKINLYREAHMTCSEILLCMVCGIFAGILPLFRVWYQVQTSLEGAVYEIRQFHSVILMERHLKGVTIPELLEDMEIFSVIFKGVLRRCINSYPSGPGQALLRMKKEGGEIHGGFAELADSFLSVDDVGVEGAFSEVEHNRGILDKISQLEAEIDIEKKRDSTDLISRIPMVLTVGVYFVLPFFVYALEGVFEVFILLEELRL